MFFIALQKKSKVTTPLQKTFKVKLQQYNLFSKIKALQDKAGPKLTANTEKIMPSKGLGQ